MAKNDDDIRNDDDRDAIDEEFEQIADEEDVLDEDDLDEVERDLATPQEYETQYKDGHTYDPEESQEQGLTYTPPTDPPVEPSDDPQGAEIAAGFGPSMETSDPDVRDLPQGVDNNDLDLEEDVWIALQNNSETSDLVDTLTVDVYDGVVVLTGTVVADNDIGRLYDILIELPGVQDVDLEDVDVAG